MDNQFSPYNTLNDKTFDLQSTDPNINFKQIYDIRYLQG